MTINDKVTIGRLGKTYGTKGWLHFYCYTTDNQFLAYSNWQIKFHNRWSPIEIEAIQPHGKHWKIKLAQVDAPETAQRYVNCELGVDRSELPKLEKGEYYWTDLIGIKVVNTRGEILGEIQSIFSTDANDVIVIEGESRTLLPYTDQVVLSVDLKNKSMVVDWDHEL